MATLDDIPTLPPATPTSDDLIAVIDGADRRSPKQVSLAQVGALGGGLGSLDVVGYTATGSNRTVTSRVAVFTGSTSAITLPAAAADLREIFIINDAIGELTITSLAAGSESIPTNSTAHLLSNGTGWYRVG